MRLFSSITIGLAVGIGLTYAWLQHVNHLIATASVNRDPEFWIKHARINAYDACYEGCHDCVDAEFAWKACRFTEKKVNLTGVICDANKMWNWADRYPIECLRAAGEVYKADALADLKRSYRWLYAGVILTVVVGIVVGTVVYKLDVWDWIASRRDQVRLNPNTLGHRGSREALLGAIFLIAIASTISPTGAYACTKFNPTYNQFFANPDSSLYGVIHGWLSDCRDYYYSCGEACSTSSSSNGDSERCSPIYCLGTETVATPRDYVVAAVGHVKACGFELVDAVPGVVGKRIANPRIEMDLWVKVAVNRFNLTDYTDPAVMCLYDMVNT